MNSSGDQRGVEAAFIISAFGDEIDDDLDTQLRLLRELGIGHLDPRSAWGVNVLKLDDAQVAAVKDACERYSISVSCIGSPVGKSLITEPLEKELSNLERAFQIAKALNTTRIRIFSFYPPDEGARGQQEPYLKESISRLSCMAEEAQQKNMLLLLENEKGLVGDTPERCQAILKTVDSPNLRFLWDPANFVVVGVARPTERGWPLLGAYIAYVHVKDALLADGTIRPAGQGDGQVAELLARLRGSGYRGFLALEPHLALAGRSGGFSGPEGMRLAASALRQLMEDVGCIEVTAAQL